MGLALQLREATTENHKRAEGASFIKDLMQGRVDREMYARHISTLYDMYLALEEGMQAAKDHPTLGAFHFDELWRADSLAADLKFFSGDDILEKRDAEQGAGTRKYCEHLRKISGESPELLVAHAYVRYLGDLSGGQMIKKTVARNLGLADEPGAAGMTFYEFPKIEDANAFKNEFRARLDAFQPANVTLEQVIDEARLAFDLNGELLRDVEAVS